MRRRKRHSGNRSITLKMFLLAAGLAFSLSACSAEGENGRITPDESGESREETAEAPEENGREAQETQETDQSLEEASLHFVIRDNYGCENFTYVQDGGQEGSSQKPAILQDIENLLWIVPRGGAGISAEACENIQAGDDPALSESESCLKQHAQETDTGWYQEMDSENTWIRVINRPSFAEPGVNEPAHKDILLYVNGEDANFALQNPEQQEMWTVWKLPGYGGWLDREIAMFLRVNTGI